MADNPCLCDCLYSQHRDTGECYGCDNCMQFRDKIKIVSAGHATTKDQETSYWRRVGDDPIVAVVRDDLLKRSRHGIAKYGVTLDRNDLTLEQWLNHQYEELLDAALYCKRAIVKLREKS